MEHFPARLSAGIRRVTTGVDARGQSVIVADERLIGDERAIPVWAGDSPPQHGAAAQPAARGWWPPPGGVRVTLSSRPPERASPAAPPAGAGDWPDISDAAGFHASVSTDIIMVLTGRIWCELDEGGEIELRAGDVLVQNGTRHRWRNHSDEWPTVAVVIVGAQVDRVDGR